MRIQRRFTLAALSVLLAAACDADVAEPGAQCTVDVQCPASQVCDSGVCASTCLAGGPCSSALSSWAGAITLAEATDLDTGDFWLKAEASFVAAGEADPGEPIAGTDCVLVKGGSDGPAGLSAGVITLQGGILSGSTADASAESTSLTPTKNAGSTEYVADLPAEGRLADGGQLLATAPGEQVPAFDAAVLVPDSLTDVATESRQMARGLGITVSWAPGNASQVLLRLTGPAAAEQAALYEPAGITSTAADEEDLDTEAASLSDGGPGAPSTVICPARDEAGTIAVSPAILELFEAGMLEATLTRQNLGFVKLPEGEVTVRAARESYFTVSHPAEAP